MIEVFRKKEVEIRPLDRTTWELFIPLQIDEEQEQFLPSYLFSIAQSKFENLFPWGIWFSGEPVGFIMYGQFEQLCWVNRIMVDKRFQRQGIGRTALELFLGYLQGLSSCKEIRTSLSKQNIVAEILFTRVGFHRTGDPVGEEIVMRWKRPS